MTFTYSLNARGALHTFECYDNNYSRSVNAAILEGRTYKKLSYVPNADTILDIGGNVGAFAVHFTLEYPSAKIYSFEPAKLPFELLVKNTSNFPNISAFNIGFYSVAGPQKLYRSTIDCVTASIKKSSFNTEDSEQVELHTLSTWLEEKKIKKIDIVKIDTEGCELPILLSIKDRLPMITAIYAEYHSEEDRRGLDELLSGTHILVSSFSDKAHRGEVTYVSTAFLGAHHEIHFGRIAP